MNFPNHTVKQSEWDGLFCVLRGHRSKFLNHGVFMSLNIVFILANSADLDEMPFYAAFHLGTHCLPKYLFISSQNKKGYLFVLISIIMYYILLTIFPFPTSNIDTPYFFTTF